MDRLPDWTAAARVCLGIDAGQADTAEIMDLVRELRRVVDRSDVFIAVYLLGVAVGRGADPREAAARLADLTKTWSGPTCDWRD